MKKLFSFLFVSSVLILSLNASEKSIAGVAVEARAKSVFPLTPETKAQKVRDKGADLPTGSTEVFSIVADEGTEYFVRRKSLTGGDFVLQKTRGGSPTQEGFFAGEEIYRAHPGTGKTITDEELIEKLGHSKRFTTPPTQSKKSHLQLPAAPRK